MSENINLRSVLESKAFPGIGPGLTNGLLSHFGADGLIARMRDMAADEFTVISGISERKANTLVAGHALSQGLVELALYLDDYGLKKPYAKTFYSVWGKKSKDVISSNPYVLLAIMDWKEVDPIGLKLGNPFHPCRVVGAIEWCMYRDYEEGKHTCTDHETLKKMVLELIGCNEVVFERGLDLALRTHAVIKYMGFYQIPATYWYERLVEKFLSDNDRTRLEESEIDYWLDNGGHKSLNPEQRQAVKNAMMYRISAYYGRGGRGKTYTLKAVADGARFKLGKTKVFLAAVAAKAVRRMQSETGHPHEYCRTIAGLLYAVDPAELNDAMVIIDEASMLSLVDAFWLIRKLPASTHIVMLGDPNQIPSIHAGRLFYDIIKNNAVPNVELWRSHRHDKKTDDQLAQVLDGEFPELDEFDSTSESGLYRHYLKPGNRMIDPLLLAEDKAVELYMDFMARGESAQIISPLRNEKYKGSSESVNQKAHKAVFKDKARFGFCKGAPVVWTENMTVADGSVLSNGSVGYVNEVYGNGSEYFLSVAFEHEGVALLEWHEVKEYLDYAYCLSVHRAQGSEWENVIIVVPYCGLIDRNMIYTALSRCKKRSIVVYHDHGYLKSKIADPPAHERRRSLLLREKMTA